MKYFSTLLALALTTRSDKNKALAQSVPKFGLPAGFGGTEQGDGNMFEIVAKDQPVLIERLDINMGEGTEPVEVYYRLGHVDNQYDDSYKLIFSGDITGAGKGLVTSLPSFTSPVLVAPGTPVTFYVTIANFYGTNMWYSVGVGSGTAYASDPNIDIIEGYANPYAGSDVIEGYANGYPWTGYTSDRQWNGVVYYSFQTTSSPTASPTKRLTASPVTNPPSVGNPNPTVRPVATQTGSPTILEVESPTPTMSPTLLILTSVPTLSPTVVDDDDDFWPFPPSSASFNRFKFMGWMCSSSFPLLFITFFVL